MKRDDAKCRGSDRKHIVGSIEQTKKYFRHQLEGECAAEHDADRECDGKLQCFVDALLLPSTEVVGENRDESVVEAEDRHEEKALQLEVHTEYSGCRRGESGEDQVHAVGHDGTDRHHQNRWNTDIVDLTDDFLLRVKNPGQRNVQLLVHMQVQEKSEDCGDALTEYSRIGGTGYAEAWKAEETENHNRVEDDIQDSTGELRAHGKHGLTSRLQLALEGQLEEKSDREHADDAEVGVTRLDDFRNARLTLDKRFRHKDADEQEDDKVYDAQKESVICGIICTLKILLAERT